MALPLGAPFLLPGFDGGLSAGMWGFRRELRSSMEAVAGVLEARSPTIQWVWLSPGSGLSTQGIDTRLQDFSARHTPETPHPHPPSAANQEIQSATGMAIHSKLA